MQNENKLSLQGWIAILGGTLGAFMAILDIQVTNASIREISGSLSLDVSESGWISSAYLIAEIIVIPLTAFLSDAIGTKRYMIYNCIGFIFFSVLCGFSGTPGALIVCRALQGLTGGTLIPMSFQLILKMMPEKQRSIGITIFGLTVTLAPTLGPSLGGWLTDTYGWRSIFFINVIPGILMLMALGYGLEWAEVKWEEFKKLDLLSVFSLSVGLSTLTYFLEEGPKADWFETTAIRYNFLAFLITLPFFIFRQFEIENPLLDLKLLRDRNFALGTVITTLAGCALFSGIYSMSLFLGQVKQYSSMQIGQILMWVGLPQLLVMPFLGFLMKRVDLRVLAIFGMALFSYSNWSNSHVSQLSSGEDFIFSLLLRALGQPLFVIPLSMMAMSSIKKMSSGDASAIFNVMRNLGASIGIAMTSTFLIRKQSMHLSELKGTISAFDFGVMEKFVKSEIYYRQTGLDVQQAIHQAMLESAKPIVIKSVVYSFNDIYGWLTLLLVGCVVLIAVMRRTDVHAGEESGMDHG